MCGNTEKEDSPSPVCDQQEHGSQTGGGGMAMVALRWTRGVTEARKHICEKFLSSELGHK